MKTKTSISSGRRLRNHNEKIARIEDVAKKNVENSNRQEKMSSGYGIKVMSIRTGIKAGWITRNYK